MNPNTTVVDPWRYEVTPMELFSLNRDDWVIELRLGRGAWFPWAGAEWNRVHEFRVRPKNILLHGGWNLCSDPKQLVRLHKFGFDVEFMDDDTSWKKWSGTHWSAKNVYRVRPKDEEPVPEDPPTPSFKSVTLRKALMKTEDYYVVEGSGDYSASDYFVMWLDKPYSVLVAV